MEPSLLSARVEKNPAAMAQHWTSRQAPQFHLQSLFPRPEPFHWLESNGMHIAGGNRDYNRFALPLAHLFDPIRCHPDDNRPISL